MEQQNLVDVFSQYGLSGLVILALFACLIWMYREHRNERKEWAERMTHQHDEVKQVVKDVGDVIKEHNVEIRSVSNFLTEIATLIKTQKRR